MKRLILLFLLALLPSAADNGVAKYGPSNAAKVGGKPVCGGSVTTNCLTSTDASGGMPISAMMLGPYTIGAGVNHLPAAASGNNGWITIVTDAANKYDCTAGGGSTAVICRSNGSAWQSFGTTTSAQLSGSISDETGSGALVFGTSPAFTTDIHCDTAGACTLGTAALPAGSAYIGGAATNNIKLTGTATGARTVTFPDFTGTAVVAATSTTATYPLFATATGGQPAYRAIAIGDLSGPMGTPVAGGIAYGSSTTRVSTTSAGTAKQLVLSGGVGTPTFLDFPQVQIINAATCNNATASSLWHLPASSTFVPTCRAGTQNLGGTLNATPSTGATAYFETELPTDWDTAVKPTIGIFYGSGTNTTGTVIWTISTGCTKRDGTVADDVSWIAESAMGTQTMTAATRAWAQSAILAGAMTNCVAGSTLYVKATLSGTASAAITLSKATVSVPRLLTVGGN